ncbi:MAG: TadE/TadG family type IV pilus assembly protein [Symbiobacteriia bacterium]
MVEFVLTVGILFLLLFGMLDLGLALNARLVVAAAAREGARRAAIEGGETAAVLERVQAQLRLGRIEPERASIQVTPHQATFGNSVAVTVDYSYPFISPVVRTLAGAGIRLHAEAVSRSEKVR